MNQLRLKNLTASKILEVQDLFNSKGWEIDNDTDHFASLYNRFCERLDLFDEPKQELILELTKNYLKIGINNVIPYFKEAISQIIEADLTKFNEILITPLISNNESKQKSSHLIWGLIQRIWKFYYEPYADKIQFVPQLMKLPENRLSKSLIIFIDDYIGTGESAIDIISGYFELLKPSCSQKNTTIAVLVAQQFGYKEIVETLKIKVLAGEIRRKGISENYPPSIASVKLKIMEDIENLLSVNEDLRFGYGKSEALVSLIEKSPNNTFPVYWYETKTKIAPFPRRRSFKYAKGS